ncbi:MAG: T9SS C-terminal target domain-containing protein [Calditrichaeota bacterium]|nr:MAG: T9SS C-terminal target domain-containing protein [Calditrichota bacterium]
MMKRLILILSCSILFSQFCLANPGGRKVMRIGGIELSPYGYGYMETHPHQPIDSTNPEFANYYAKISLILGGITTNGDTTLTYSRLSSTGETVDFKPKRLFQDTTNVLGLPNVEFTTISIYGDVVNGWRVGQFNIALQDHSAGILAFSIRYNGSRGNLHDVYAGIHFDFDVPNVKNHPSSDDDQLTLTPFGYQITDFYSHQGMEVAVPFSPVIRNYVTRSQLPTTAKEVYGLISNSIFNTPQDTADYHFYIGSGPFSIRGGENIILIYAILPLSISNGFSKASSDLFTKLESGMKNFYQGKPLATIDESHLQMLTSNFILPEKYQLFQNFPNPFNPTTKIRFQIPESSHSKSGVDVRLEVFNILGQKVKTLLHQTLKAGTYTVEWDGANKEGMQVASGIYIYRLSTDDFQIQKKMLLIR